MTSKEVENIIQSQNYITPSRYISGRIIEYDIKSANISTLRMQNIISQDEYMRLSSLPKIDREVEIGLMEREDVTVYGAIQEGIRISKLALVDNNNIVNPDSIIRVANDAVYINTPIELKNTRFGDFIEFKKKSEARYIVNLNGILVLISVLPDGNIDVDVKGIRDNAKLHLNYMINIIVSSITLLENSGVNHAINYLSRICEDYLNFRLPVEFYREFSPESCYRIKSNDYFLNTLGVDRAREIDKYQMDINYNYNVLRELWSILIDIYNRRQR